MYINSVMCTAVVAICFKNLKHILYYIYDLPNVYLTVTDLFIK